MNVTPEDALPHAHGTRLKALLLLGVGLAALVGLFEVLSRSGLLTRDLLFGLVGGLTGMVAAMLVTRFLRSVSYRLVDALKPGSIPSARAHS